MQQNSPQTPVEFPVRSVENRPPAAIISQRVASPGPNTGWTTLNAYFQQRHAAIVTAANP